MRVLSAATLTSSLTLGNYIGAIRNWIDSSKENDCFYMVADLHALTVERKSPKTLEEESLSFIAQYIACGLDPQKCTLFVQSHIPAHSELTWILTCLTPMGYLNRMTQFKDKSSGQKNIGTGLYTYPVLMASDILLYQADVVPVGEDQKQHLELTRDIVGFFHNRYGEVFKLPKGETPKLGAKVMSLQDPTKKMSKSDTDPKATIFLDDPLKKIEKKIKGAVTDSGSEISFCEETKAGLSNLLTIYSVMTGKSIESIVKSYEGKMYGHLKVDLAEIVVEFLRPIQKKYQTLMSDRAELLKVIKLGEQKANAVASQTLRDVHSKLGLLKR